MGLREATGYLAHIVLAQYWLWAVSTGIAQLRTGQRSRATTVRLLAVKTAGVAVTALLVGVIHFWATEWWHVVLAAAVAGAVAVPLRRAHRALATVPRHRLTLRQRSRHPHRPEPGDRAGSGVPRPPALEHPNPHRTR